MKILSHFIWKAVHITCVGFVIITSQELFLAPILNIPCQVTKVVSNESTNQNLGEREPIIMEAL